MGFDPNKPFTPVKKGFDPSRPFQRAGSSSPSPELSDKMPSDVSLAPRGAAQQDIKDVEAMDPQTKAMTAKLALGAVAGGLGGEAAAGMGMLGRAGVNALSSGAQRYVGNLIDKKDDSTEGVLGSAGLGGAISLGADAVGGLYGGLKRMYQTGRWAADPAAMQDAAISAVSDATDKLKSSEAENLKNYLSGKSIPIDTTRIRGINPEIDSILGKYADPYGQINSGLTVEAQDANRIRQLLDGEISYRKLGPFAQTAEVAERDAAIKKLADNLRGQVHDVSPEVSDTLDQWSDNLNAARNLDKRAETAPITVLTSPSVDRRALLQKVDEQVGTNLQGLGSQLNDSKNLSNAVHNIQPLKALGTLGLAGLKGTANAASQGTALSDPAVVQSLFGAVNAASDNPQSTPAPRKPLFGQ